MNKLLTQLRDRAGELADRAAVTAAEGALLAVGSDSVSANALALDWKTIAGYALGGAFLSVAINVSRTGLSGHVDEPVPADGPEAPEDDTPVPADPAGPVIRPDNPFGEGH
jgi:hypothetical protein